MGISTKTINPSNAPAILPDEATFPGMLRREGDQPLTLDEFERLLIGTVHDLQIEAERTLETDRVTYKARAVDDIGQELWAFATGDPVEEFAATE